MTSQSVYGGLLLMGFACVFTAQKALSKEKTSLVSKGSPVVSQVRGEVFFEERQVLAPTGKQGGLFPRKKGSESPIKEGTLLITGGTFTTSPEAQARIELDSENAFILLGDSKVEFSLLSDEKKSAFYVVLISGKMRVISAGSNQIQYGTPVTNDFYQFGEFILSYDSSLVRATMTSVRGVFQFRGFQGESSSRIGPGEQAYFQGVLEDGAPVFDFLLKSKKVARGELGPVIALPKAEYEILDSSTQFKKLEKPKQIEKRPKRVDHICDKPPGRFNDCVWQKKQSACVRRRCNANGQWVDSHETPLNRGGICSPKGTVDVVGPCDY